MDISTTFTLARSTWNSVTFHSSLSNRLIVQIDKMTFEFADPKLERIVALTAADRRWMDDVVRTVEETYELPEGERSS